LEKEFRKNDMYLYCHEVPKRKPSFWLNSDCTMKLANGIIRRNTLREDFKPRD